MDNQLNIGVRVDASQAEAGMTAAANSVSEGAQRMRQGFMSAAEAAQVINQGQREMKDLLDAAGGSINENNALWGLYQETAAKVTAAQEALAAATAATTAATEKQAAAATVASAGLDRQAYNMAYASGYAGSYALGLRGVGFMLGRIGATSETLAPILSAVFPLAIAGLFAEQAVQIAASFHKWYEDTVNLRTTLSDLRTLVGQIGGSLAAAHYKVFESQASILRAQGHPLQAIHLLQQHISDRPLMLKIGINQADLDKVQKTLSDAGSSADVRSLINALQLPSTTLGQGLASIAQIRSYITEINTVEQQQPGIDANHLDALNLAKQALVEIGAQILDNQDADNKDLEAQEIAARKKLKAVYDRISAAGAGAALANVLIGPDQYQQGAKKIEQADQAEAHAKKHLNDLLAHQADNQARLNNAIRNYAGLHGLSAGAATGMIPLATSPSVPGAGEAPLDTKKVDKFFAGMNRSMDQAVQGVVMGTQTMQQAWRHLFANMVIGQTEALAQMMLKFSEHLVAKEALLIAHSIKKSAIEASGIARSKAVEDAAHAHEKVGDAKSGAVAVWNKVLHALPFPANVIVAPIAAGAEFSAMMAFERGGVVPTTGPALVHQHEMVLPAHIAQHVLDTAGGGGGGGRNINVTTNVHALDGADAHSVLTRHSASIAQGVQREMRRRGLV